MGAEIPRPQALISDELGLNAFAYATRTGGVVAVNRAGLEQWNSQQLEAVMAHEIGHLKNRDTVWRITTRALVRALLIHAAIVVGMVVIAGLLSGDDEGTNGTRRMAGMVVTT